MPTSISLGVSKSGWPSCAHAPFLRRVRWAGYRPRAGRRGWPHQGRAPWQREETCPWSMAPRLRGDARYASRYQLFGESGLRHVTRKPASGRSAARSPVPIASVSQSRSQRPQGCRLKVVLRFDGHAGFLHYGLSIGIIQPFKLSLWLY